MSRPAAVVAAVAAAVGLAACAGRAGRGPAAGAAAGADVDADARLLLHRDGAVVEERFAIEVGAGASTVHLPRPRGVDAVIVLGDRDAQVRGWTAIDPEALPGAAGAAPGLAVDVVAPRAGRARLTLAYVTPHLTWQAGYTLIDERGRGRLHGALALRNDTGRRWERAQVVVADRPLATATAALATAPARVLIVPGVHAIAPGAQRLDLALAAVALPLVPTLVYDPVGARLDSATLRPSTDPRLGVARWPRWVDESLLVDLGRVAAAPLPAGPVRVLAVDGDRGALRWRGQGQLLPAAADSQRHATVAIGRAAAVRGSRRRTDFALDLDAMRLVEEITVTLDNRGPRPVDVLVREHLYRGQCWTLAYHSTGSRVAKEGAQQLGLGVTVPAAGTATVMYRVVYEWDERVCRPGPERRE